MRIPTPRQLPVTGQDTGLSQVQPYWEAPRSRWLWPSEDDSCLSFSSWFSDMFLSCSRQWVWTEAWVQSVAPLPCEAGRLTRKFQFPLWPWVSTWPLQAAVSTSWKWRNNTNTYTLGLLWGSNETVCQVCKWQGAMPMSAVCHQGGCWSRCHRVAYLSLVGGGSALFFIKSTDVTSISCATVFGLACLSQVVWSQVVPGGRGLKLQMLSFLAAPAFEWDSGNGKTFRVQRNTLLTGLFPLDEVQQTWAGLGWAVVRPMQEGSCI